MIVQYNPIERRSILDYLIFKQEDVGDFPEQSTQLKPKCDYIPKKYETKPLVKIPTRKRTDEKPFKCEICSYASNFASNYKRHYKTVHVNSDHKTSLKTTIHQCEFCPKQYQRRSLLEIHIRNHTGERPFTCEICKAAFKNPSNYRRHCKTMHPNGDFKTSVKSTKYQCEYCSNHYEKKYLLKNHTRKHTGERPFECEICQYSSSFASNYKRHVKRIHGNSDRKRSLKPTQYQCDFCPKQFKGKILFQIHTRKHTGEKPFKCEICNYASNNPSNYKRHCKKVH